jgi:hypothetical protein
VTKRFNLFRREQWIGIHTRLMQGQLLARKVMGLYMLKDTNVQRWARMRACVCVCVCKSNLFSVNEALTNVSTNACNI